MLLWFKTKLRTAQHLKQVGDVDETLERFGLRDAHYSKGNIFEASPRPRTRVWQYSVKEER